MNSGSVLRILDYSLRLSSDGVSVYAPFIDIEVYAFVTETERKYCATGQDDDRKRKDRKIRPKKNKKTRRKKWKKRNDRITENIYNLIEPSKFK